jgi:hypothetical protein
MMSKLFPGQVLKVDIDKYRSKSWIYVEGLVENSERLDGWVYSKYIQSFVCPSSLEKPSSISTEAQSRAP